MRRTKIAFGILLGSLLFSPSLSASDSVTRAEYEALLSRVEKLESILSSLHIEADNELESTTVSSRPVAKEKPKKSLLDSVVGVIQKREDTTTYPWMEKSLWDTLQPGMSPKEIQSILGIPTLDEPSLHKRIDTVYTYKGKQRSTGIYVKGIIRFYRNRLVEIEPPEIQ